MGLVSLWEHANAVARRNDSWRNDAGVSTLIRPLVFLGFYLVLASLAFQGLNLYFSEDHPQRWTGVTLLLSFFLLSISCYWLTRRFLWYSHLYMLLQGVITLGLLIIPPYQDFWAILFLLLSAEAMLLFPQRIGYLWLGIFVLVMSLALLYTMGWQKGLPLALLYGTGTFFFGSFATLMAQAESDKAELQEAHKRLQAQASQAEELAAARERNRLARDLHDSVTQSLFGMTLTAESASILLVQDPSKVAPQLARLQELARGALAEMRSLILHLRPTEASEDSLVAAIRNYLDTVGSREGLAVEFQSEGDGELSREQEEAIFRIVQEALNNVARHARTDKAAVTLRVKDGTAWLVVEDQGVGFDPSLGPLGDGHFGLTGMRERVEILEGSLKVDSQPGRGTRIMVEVPYNKAG